MGEQEREEPDRNVYVVENVVFSSIICNRVGSHIIDLALILWIIFVTRPLLDVYNHLVDVWDRDDDGEEGHVLQVLEVKDKSGAVFVQFFCVYAKRIFLFVLEVRFNGEYNVLLAARAVFGFHSLRGVSNHLGFL